MIKIKIIKRTNDLAFKKAFGSNETKHILAALFFDFFGVKPEKIEIITPYNIETYRKFLEDASKNKLIYTISDIKAIMELGNLGVELQMLKQLYFDQRSLYYPFTSFVNSYNTKKEQDKTNPYGSLKPIYAINILGYNNFKTDENGKEDKDALRIFNLYDIKRNKKFTNAPDIVNLAYFELKKTNVETENQRHWQDYFLGKEIKKEAPNYIKEAEFIVNKINMNEEEVRMLTVAERLEADYISGLEYATLEGEQKGMQKGMQKGIRQGRQEGIEIGTKQAVETINLLINEGYSLEEALKKVISK